MIDNLINKALIIKINPQNNTKFNLTASVKMMLNQILKSVKKNVSDDKRYATIIEKFVNEDKRMNYKTLTFAISQDSDKFSGHMLEIIIPHPNKEIGLKRPLAYGTKNQIIEFLENADSIKSVKKDIEEMNKELSGY